jgi:hypothetical protein
MYACMYVLFMYICMYICMDGCVWHKWMTSGWRDQWTTLDMHMYVLICICMYWCVTDCICMYWCVTDCRSLKSQKRIEPTILETKAAYFQLARRPVRKAGPASIPDVRNRRLLPPEVRRLPGVDLLKFEIF